MSGLEALLLETAPDVIGLALASYFAFLVYRLREDFFVVARSFVLIFLVASIVVLWAMKLLDYEIGGAHAHIETDMTFVVISLWLSACWMSMTALYRGNDPMARFGDWFRSNPLNLLTIWGLVGLALIVAIWAPFLAGSGAEYYSELTVVTLCYLIAVAAFDVAMVLKAGGRGFFAGVPGEGSKAIVLLLAVWLGIPFSEYTLDVILGTRMGLETYGIEDWIVIALFAMMLGWVGRRGFLAIFVEPEEETVKLAGYRMYDIPRGVYLVEEEKPDAAFRLFAELVTLPLRPDVSIPGAEESASATLEFLIPRGLVITREYPESVRENYKLQVTPIIWLTESPGDRKLAPTSLAVLTDTLIRFMEANPNGIVLLEGLEYLVTFNDFRKVQRQLDSLNETAWVTKTRLLVSVNPKAFDEKELALLERDREVLEGSSDIEELKMESAVKQGPTE